MPWTTRTKWTSSSLRTPPSGTVSWRGSASWSSTRTRRSVSWTHGPSTWTGMSSVRACISSIRTNWFSDWATSSSRTFLFSFWTEYFSLRTSLSPVWAKLFSFWTSLSSIWAFWFSAAAGAIIFPVRANWFSSWTSWSSIRAFGSPTWTEASSSGTSSACSCSTWT